MLKQGGFFTLFLNMKMISDTMPLGKLDPGKCCKKKIEFSNESGSDESSPKLANLK